MFTCEKENKSIFYRFSLNHMKESARNLLPLKGNSRPGPVDIIQPSNQLSKARLFNLKTGGEGLRSPLSTTHKSMRNRSYTTTYQIRYGWKRKRITPKYRKFRYNSCSIMRQKKELIPIITFMLFSSALTANSVA